jgi:endonuclease/exonuclease/phosphatase family metal-dependent hydrolase
VAEVRWYGPDRDKDIRSLWWRCIGVGPALVWAPESTAAEPIDSLVVVSWNIHVGGADLADLVQDLRAGKLTQGGPPRHFVLLLQEAYRTGLDSPPVGFIGTKPIIMQPTHPPRVDIKASAQALGLFLYYVPSTRNGREEHREDRGNAILSTLPLSDLKAYELPFEIHRRVALSAAIEGSTSKGDPWSVTLASAHLDATSIRPAIYRDLGAVRKRQATSLAALLGQDSSIILGGDFNTLFKGEAALGVFGDQIGRIPGSDTRSTKPPFQPDHLFARLPARWRIEPYRRLESAYHSDHYPLITEIFFSPGPVSGPGSAVGDRPGSQRGSH